MRKNSIFTGNYTHAHAQTCIFPMTKVNANKPQELYERIVRFIPVILAVLLWSLLTFNNHYFLKKVEDLSLFMFDKLFLVEWFKTPGGFLGLAGSFFTQFLHLPWLGALLWTALLYLAYFLTYRILRIPDRLRLLALIPIALIVIGNMSLGYGVFIMREQDHFFAPTLGYIFSLLPLAICRRMNRNLSRILLLVIWSFAGFELLGMFALSGVLTAALGLIATSAYSRKEGIRLTGIAIALVILVPVIMHPLYVTYRLAASWNMGLPTPSVDAWTGAIRLPYQLSLILAVLFAATAGRMASASPTFSREITVQAIALILSVSTVWGFWYRDENFRTELAMSDAIDNYDWNKAIDIYTNAARSHSKSDEKAYLARTAELKDATNSDEAANIVDKYSKRFFEPTRTMVIYRDLALLKTGQALDRCFTMKDGGRPQNSRTQLFMAYQSGRMLYFQYGLVNMSYRWCLEDVIEHSWSFGTLKYMAMHSIIMQEAELAQKYVNKLSKTLFYRKWAREQQALESDSLAMAASDPYRQVLPYMCFESRMSNDVAKPEVYIMSHFVDEPVMNPTPEYATAALYFAMRTQNIPAFWDHLRTYVLTAEFDKLPVSVQEAVTLYNNLEKSNIRIPVDKAVTDRYDSFNKFVQSHPIRSIKESSYIYSKSFGSTFYYYYYFIRNLQTY